jgi:hypothetical protein
MVKRNSNNNKPLSPVKLASYGKVKVYKSNHIKLDANLLDTLGIRPGDRVGVFLDTEERAIVIKGREEYDGLQSSEQMDK